MTSLLEDKGTIIGVQYKTKSGEVVKAFAPLTIVCDGCFSNLRRSLCKPQVHCRMFDQSLQHLLNNDLLVNHRLMFPRALLGLFWTTVNFHIQITGMSS